MGSINKFFRGTDKKEVLSWALYDFANSAYVIIVVSFIFPIFYRDLIAGSKLGDFYWGLIVSLSALLAALAAPIVGAIADEHKRKKSQFVFLVCLSAIGSALLYFTGSGTLLWASILFVATNLLFEIAQTLYDSFLSDISTRETVGRISGLAWGLGYIGGVAALLIFKPIYGGGFEGVNEHLYKLTFPLTALFFLLFSLPAFVYLKQQPQKISGSAWKLSMAGIRRAAGTIKNFRSYKNIAWFLLGLYLFNDAIVTLFAFLPIFGRTTIGLSISEITILLLLVQVLAFPFTALFGWISDHKGPKPILILALLGWLILTIMVALAQSKGMFYAAAIFGSLVFGSSQAVARSWLARIVPADKQAEFFGFNGFASKVAATTGPVLFGAVSSATGNQRIAVLVLIPFFVTAIIIFSRIKDEARI